MGGRINKNSRHISKFPMKYVASILFFSLIVCISTLNAAQTLLLRQPALSENNLAFVYAGDIWIAEDDGTHPRRLTSHPAEENNPVFSPDGKWIAFAASYDGNTDVYIIPVEGGQPKRLTWHPKADLPQDWSKDSRTVAFVSSRETDHGRSKQLYHVSIEGGLPEKQMEARIHQGSYSDSGELAYIIFGPAYNGLMGGTSGWKGYEGGSAPEVMIMNADRTKVSVIPGKGSNHFNPFWLGNKVYFLSDRQDEIFNLFQFDPSNGKLSQISQESLWDIRAAQGFGSVIVYEAGGRIKKLHTKTGKIEELAIHISPDLPQLRPSWKKAGDTVQYFDLSTTGKRALLTARGEVFSVPLKDGPTRNLSLTGGKREYSALWAPDGQKAAWITETDDGGQEIMVVDSFGKDLEMHFPLGSHFYELKTWTAGDSSHLIYTDNHLGLHVLELTTGESHQIATEARRAGFQVSASPDGKWIAYTLEQANFNQDLMLYNIEQDQSYRISDGMADVASPAFSPDGKYLYFNASTNSGPLQVGLNMTSQERPFRAALYAAILSSDEKSPLLPKSGDEKIDESDEKTEKSDEEEDEDPQPVTHIDLEGLSDRIIALPVAVSNYDNLQVGSNGDLFYIHHVQPGGSRTPPGESTETGDRLMRFNLEKKEETELLKEVANFSINSSGSHMIIQKIDGQLVTAEIGDKMETTSLDLSQAKILVNPREEWRQIFNEAWRMEKEYFYAKNLHGIDWDAIYQQYRPLVDHVGRREDLTALMVEMIAELQVGHNRTGGGDIHKETSVSSGLLGINLSIENDHYRIDHIYTGESWNPFLQGPLSVPGNEAYVGEYILAVNDRDITSQDNLFSCLQGTVGEQVTLKVGPHPNNKDSREIMVEPIANERALRLWDWVEKNRLYVDAETEGRVAYIYLPDTGGRGYTFFNRMFFSQVDKEALIIDERSNGGGQAANYLIEVLGRKHLSGWSDRDGLIYNTPAGAQHGPKVMLIDQDAGSGGDFLPYAFRYTGLGKLIGTRTWGGLIGIATNPSLMDGGFIVVPFFRFFDPDGNWSVENEGVTPDIEVMLDPIAANRLEDTQLDAAITEIQSQLKDYKSKILKVAPTRPSELGE